MKTVLITAFEPYDRWKTNASWLALVQLTQNLPARPKIVTRLYPVDFSTVKQRLGDDLATGFDYAIHLGQAPGSSRVQLEAIGINVGGSSTEAPDQYRALADDGPVAYRSPLPLGDWAVKLRAAGIPAQVSYHAGTYLCNATLYWSCYLTERMGLNTRAAFVHLPLDTSQVVSEPHGAASFPAALSAAALRLILGELA
ncbi:MAG TPA: pyroglutamyl-peptidase I [Pirellulales bacterium]|jgi:pyroglutamyl-peptidase|nr:pyroglutamyl-peptidase I [Pirellulales bacterium]